MDKLVEMLNAALEMEYGSYIQYLTHAELFKGPDADVLTDRFKELASDEAKHAAKYRNLLAQYIEVVPSMGTRGVRQASNNEEIIERAIDAEKEGIEFYQKIYEELRAQKEKLKSYLTFEHEVRHILMDEHQHLIQLETLKGKK